MVHVDQAGTLKKSIWAGDAQCCPGWEKVLTERLTGIIQVKPSRDVLRWQGGRDWPAPADEADVAGEFEFGLRLSAF